MPKLENALKIMGINFEDTSNIYTHETAKEESIDKALEYALNGNI
jgi:hypothetical protein